MTWWHSERTLQVMADEQISQPVALLQRFQQRQDLRLHRFIQRRGRLVEDQQRLQDQRARDGDTLTLAAGKLGGIAMAQLRIGRLPATPRSRAVPRCCAKPLVHFQPFGDDLLHVQARIQGGVGILEDDLHPAAVGQHLLHRERVQRFAVEPDGAL